MLRPRHLQADRGGPLSEEFKGGSGASSSGLQSGKRARILRRKSWTRRSRRIRVSPVQRRMRRESVFERRWKGGAFGRSRKKELTCMCRVSSFSTQSSTVWVLPPNASSACEPATPLPTQPLRRFALCLSALPDRTRFGSAGTSASTLILSNGQLGHW
jgi:hypothetical protein